MNEAILNMYRVGNGSGKRKRRESKDKEAELPNYTCLRRVAGRLATTRCTVWAKSWEPNEPVRGGERKSVKRANMRDCFLGFRDLAARWRALYTGVGSVRGSLGYRDPDVEGAEEPADGAVAEVEVPEPADEEEMEVGNQPRSAS